MWKVRLGRDMAGPKGIFRAGSVVEISETEAKHLIGSGQAKLVEAPEARINTGGKSTEYRTAETSGRTGHKKSKETGADE